MKTCSRALRISDWGEGSPSNNDPTHTAKTTQEWLWDKSLNVLECPSQRPDLNPIEHLWRDLKIAVQQRSPSNLTEPERRRMGETPQIQVCQACSVIPKKTRGCNHCQRCFNKLLSKKGLNIYVSVIFHYLIHFISYICKKVCKELFLPCHYWVLCVE